MEDLRFFEISPRLFHRYFELVAVDKKKGANRGYKRVYIPRELKEGESWGEYLRRLEHDEPANHAVTMIHELYLKLRRDAAAYNDPDDLDAFKGEVRRIQRRARLKYAAVRPYLTLTMSDLREQPRIKHELTSIEG